MKCNVKITKPDPPDQVDTVETGAVFRVGHRYYLKVRGNDHGCRCVCLSTWDVCFIKGSTECESLPSKMEIGP